jgi:AcrR family transcriptional regulator
MKKIRDPRGQSSARREREAQWARAAIVEAAAAVFSRRGYHGATMENIARAAGYSPAAIYKYFDNKEAVFLAYLRAIKKRFFDVFGESPPFPLAFDDYLRWILARIFAIAEENRSIFVSFVAQRSCILQDDRSSADMEAREFYRESRALFAGFMKRGMAEGALGDGDPADYASAFLGIIHAFVFRWGSTSRRSSVFSSTAREHRDRERTTSLGTIKRGLQR